MVRSEILLMGDITPGLIREKFGPSAEAIDSTELPLDDDVEDINEHECNDKSAHENNNLEINNNSICTSLADTFDKSALNNKQHTANQPDHILLIDDYRTEQEDADFEFHQKMLRWNTKQNQQQYLDAENLDLMNTSYKKYRSELNI